MATRKPPVAKPVLTPQQRQRIAERQLREQNHPLLQPLGRRQPARSRP